MTRPPPLDRFLSTSSEDLRAASPPYRREASSSNLHSTLEVPEGVYAYPPSPAYHSSVDMSEPPPEVDEKVPIDDVKAKPTVHYVDSNTARPAGLVQASSSRFQDEVSSRPPSIAGTDDEEEEEVYDWSGEEDLVDEEAKFEERMGKKQKNKTWGFKRLDSPLLSIALAHTSLLPQSNYPSILVPHWIGVSRRCARHSRDPRPLLLVFERPHRPPSLCQAECAGLALLGSCQPPHFLGSRSDHRYHPHCHQIYHIYNLGPRLRKS